MNTTELLIKHRTFDPNAVAILETKYGDLIVITIYGPDDFSAWWTDTAHLECESYGYSVRGTLKDILDEMKDDI